MRPNPGRQKAATPARSPRARVAAFVASLGCLILLSGCIDSSPPDDGESPVPGTYPLHTKISATTFWVGEIFDPDASDGSQVLSTYDSLWIDSYGGCDGRSVDGSCETERRRQGNDFFPTAMTPLENPFYLDLPYDDINDEKGFAMRDEVIPWANESPYKDHSGDRNFSYLKNRWVQISRAKRVCYGQIQDAGPAKYHDHAYVFGSDDARPANKRWDGAGLDVSPAINSCLNFDDLDGTQRVNWRFVEEDEVPEGPWTRIITTRGVQ